MITVKHPITGLDDQHRDDRSSGEPNEEDVATIEGVNEELYSRQLYVMGADAQRKLQRSRILVSGELSGVGAEICKNIVLAGVHSLSLHDNSSCSYSDLASAGFLFTESDVNEGKMRSMAAANELQNMNALVSVSCVTSAEPDYLAFDVVVLVNPDKDTALRVSSLLRAPNNESKTRLIISGSYGLFAYTFSDFGKSWQVTDPDGELTKSGLILSGIAADKNEIEVCTEFPHRLSDGDWVKFTCEEYKDEPKQIKLVNVPGSKYKVDELRFRIPSKDPSSLAVHLSGAYFEQVKKGIVITSHKQFAQSLEEPLFCNNSFEDDSKPRRLFVLLCAIWTFQDSQKDRRKLPQTTADIESILRTIEQSTVLSESHREEMRALIETAAGNISPVASFIGGVAGQEVLKACTGKFTPLEQWLMYSATECLQFVRNAASLVSPSRYQAQLAVFGEENQRKLGSLRVLVVGAGALGCEILKNLVLMGVSTKKDGGITYVTDPDAIELSNLSRQFLFRPQSVGKNKAVVAVEAVREMNPDFQVEAFQERVSADDKSGIFTDTFWDSLDLVINALDNVPSRLYVDSQCVYYGKPLLESGTLGTKANTLPVIPNLTESYGSDPVKDFDSTTEIPACTLHAYPNLFEHVLTWARDAVFERDFVVDPSEAKMFLDAQNKGHVDDYIQQLQRQPNSMAQKLRAAREVICGIDPSDHPEGLFPYSFPTHVNGGSPQVFTFKHCVLLARLKFQELFSNKIDVLLHQHPPASKDGDAPFWSGKRRLPAPAKFDASDASHMLFVTSAAKLFARIHSIKVSAEDLNRIKVFLQEATAYITPFQVPSTDQEAHGNQSDSWKNDIELLKKSAALTISIEPQRFDKDDDLHIDLVWSAAMVRATIYKIPTLAKMEAKRVVGRIIPAIATSTASATGLVAIELYKCVFSTPSLRTIDTFRASNFNLAVNTYASFEPRPCRGLAKFGTWSCNLWSVITLKGNLTVQELVDKFEEDYNGFQISSIVTTGSVTLYNDLFSGGSDVMDTPIADLYRKVVGKEPPEVFIPLTIDGDFEDIEVDEEDVVIPPVRLRWKE